MALRFTWDSSEAARNKQKHGVSFEMAIRVFSDPFALSEQDRIEGGNIAGGRLGPSMESSFCSLPTRQTMMRGSKSCASFRLGEPSGTKEDAMGKKDFVTYDFDPEDPKPLTAAERAEVSALARLPDDQIDTTDIPPASESFWKNAVRNPFYRPVKRQLTVRVDSDVLAWLRAAGRGYQTKLNAILREAMVRDVNRR